MNQTLPHTRNGIAQDGVTDTMPKTIGIVGSRRRDTRRDYEILIRMFDSIYQIGDWIVSGGCWKGADRFAEMIADERCIPIMILNADWDKHGKAAGPIRNTDIAQWSSVLLAMVASDRTGGTEDTVRKTKGLGRLIHLL